MSFLNKSTKRVTLVAGIVLLAAGAGWLLLSGGQRVSFEALRGSRLIEQHYRFMPEDSGRSGIAYTALYEVSDKDHHVKIALEQELMTRGYVFIEKSGGISEWRHPTMGQVATYSRRGEKMTKQGVFDPNILGVSIFQPVEWSWSNRLRAGLDRE